jgi:hypothetical protein
MTTSLENWKCPSEVMLTIPDSKLFTVIKISDNSPSLKNKFIIQFFSGEYPHYHYQFHFAMEYILDGIQYYKCLPNPIKTVKILEALINLKHEIIPYDIYACNESQGPYIYMNDDEYRYYEEEVLIGLTCSINDNTPSMYD